MRSYAKILGTLFIAYILTTIIVMFLGNWHNYDVYELDDHISVEIIRTNGDTEYYAGNKFAMLNRGDRMFATIEIPAEYELEDPALCFHVYNSILSLSFEGEEFYRYGDQLANSGQHMGTIYEAVPFPKEAIGKSITLKCVANENQAMNQLTDVTVMSTRESAKAPLVNNLFDALMFITIFMVSCMGLLVLFFSRGKDKIVRMGSCIALFSVLVSLYILSSNGSLHALIGSRRIVANLEYISLFALPIPFGAFFNELHNMPILKKILGAVSVYYLLFFSICTVLNYTTTEYHYCRFLLPLHVSMVLGILLFVGLSFLKNAGQETDEGVLIIRDGVLLLLIVGLIDVLRFNLNQYSESIIFKFTLLPMGMLIMMLSLCIGAVTEWAKRYKEKEEKRQLERLAYIDIMTGLCNRAKCYAYVDEMKKTGKQEYTVIFVDLNNLKVANDKYGHELGDQYIKTAAATMQKCFPDAAIISRFGGDEFVVLYDGNYEDRVEELVDDFRKEFERLNEGDTFPFCVGAACGAVLSTKETPLDIEEALNMADQVMYEDKKRMKAYVNANPI